MATVKPFLAVRPKEGLEEKIAALPYDVYNRKEAKEYVLNNPLSFLKIDRAESQFPDSVDTYDERVYLKAKEMYEKMKEEGKFIKEEKPSFYLYEQTMDERSQTGLVSLASVKEYEKNIIKKHENTRAEKELDRINHVNTMNAQSGPIFLAYRNNESLNEFFKKVKESKPYSEFMGPLNVYQRLWKIDKEEDILFIINAFKDIENLYIADGHHRCASACRVSKMRRDKENPLEEKEYDYFLSVIFSDSELLILDYNRVVKDLNGLTREEFLKKVSLKFTVTERESGDDKPLKKGDIFMLFKDKEYVIRLKSDFVSDDPIKSLDVSVLQDNLLDPILNIKDPKTDSRIDFVGGIRGVKELRKRLQTDAIVSFSMYPTSISELFNVADNNLLMPPKSTWFEPKLLSGLFIHELD